MTDDPGARPEVKLRPRHQRRVRAGHPWVYSNEIVMDETERSLAPGSLVTVVADDGRRLGVATFNPHTLVSLRILARDPGRNIDREFLADRLKRALKLRESFYEEPFYRLVHGEADGLPGLVVDRYGEVLVCQTATAGMERLLDDILAALDALLDPRVVVLKNESRIRALEGLDSYVRTVKGALDGPVEVRENGVRSPVDVIGGQKTGWFYDQRDNRAFMARLSWGRRVLDLYCYAGGFAVQAVVAGAREAIGVDRSQPALALGEQAAALNGVAERCRWVRSEAFGQMAEFGQAGERFDVVIADPPAFVKSKKDLQIGARAYRKMVRLAAKLVAPDGFLLVSTCSHNVDAALFAQQVRRGLHDVGRAGRVVRAAGAGPDHPVEPYLPESAYLKIQVLHLE